MRSAPRAPASPSSWSRSTASRSPKGDAIIGRRSPPSPWSFPGLDTLPPGDDLIAIGADLEVPTLLTAYESGYFPMPLQRRRIGWFSPDPRGVLLPGRLRVTRSLRRSIQSFRFSTNQAFDEVIRACGDPSRPQGWIDGNIIGAYTRLHLLGWAHSVEVWDDKGLAGGLYGIRIGGFFAGESMFHRRSDASKAALVHLVDLLGEREDSLIDVQWATPHLESLGVEAVPRRTYATLLPKSLALSERHSFTDPDRSATAR